jgi:hypothetical protein
MRGDVARFTYLRLGYGDGLRLGLIITAIKLRLDV